MSKITKNEPIIEIDSYEEQKICYNYEKILLEETPDLWDRINSKIIEEVDLLDNSKFENQEQINDQDKYMYLLNNKNNKDYEIKKAIYKLKDKKNIHKLVYITYAFSAASILLIVGIGFLLSSGLSKKESQMENYDYEATEVDYGLEDAASSDMKDFNEAQTNNEETNYASDEKSASDIIFSNIAISGELIIIDGEWFLKNINIEEFQEDYSKDDIQSLTNLNEIKLVNKYNYELIENEKVFILFSEISRDPDYKDKIIGYVKTIE